MMPTLSLTLLPGAHGLLAAHERELPQRDDLCGAFCGALSLAAAGLHDAGGAAFDQDAVGLAAGSLVSATPDPGILPFGETGRRDYRLELPSIADGRLSGTTAAGVVEAIEQLSEERLKALPLSGPWTDATLAATFDLAAESVRPVTLLANHATRHLWGSGASRAELLDYLLNGRLDGPAPDWDVGHFACLFGAVMGPSHRLYALADTYPALGHAGVHLQPAERLALALARPGGPGGGIIAVVAQEDAARFSDSAKRLGLREGVWDNGTPAREAAA